MIKRRKKLYRFVSILVISVLLFSVTQTKYVFAGETLIEQYPPIESEIDYSKNDVYYFEYSKKHSANIALDSVEIDLNNNICSDGKSHLVYENDTQYFDWSDDNLDWVEWSFKVPQEGLYNIVFDYMTIEGSVATPTRSLTIDGKELFRELSDLQFPRIWTDANEPVLDSLGNAISPQQTEISRRQITRITDSMGRYNEPFKIKLTEGEHKIRLSMQRGFLKIFNISLLPPEEILSYNEVFESYNKAGYKEAAPNMSIKINAENAIEKNDVVLQRTYNSDPCSDPVANGNKILNTIGGENWNKGNQTITWKFNVTHSALYRLDLRLFTKYSDELNIYRQILVDGKVPFKEFENYCFTYGKWRTESLSNEKGEPYLLYLTQGEHTLSISVKTASYLEILSDLEESLDVLSVDIQKIIKITSVSPDSNFDYQLNKKIPTLLDDFSDVAKNIGTQMENLKNIIGEMPSGANSLLEIKYRLEKMIDDPYIIARNLTYLQDSETTLSTWINAFNNLPMELDYIIFNSPSVEVKDPQANIFQYVWSVLRDFLQSFSKEYNTVNGSDFNGYDKKIKIWLARGKEWGTLLKQYSDEDFTANTGINVEYSILPSGQLGTGGIMMLAVASGTAPDIALGLDSAVPGEYGMRDVALDLSSFSNYKDVESRFTHGAMIPYYFNSGTYGLPETVNFGLLFYRKDIFIELNLENKCLI